MFATAKEVREMASIQGSVGKKGKNDKWDVMTMQTLLNKFIVPGCLPGLKPLVPDGACGNATIGAITAFQAGILEHKYPDGRIDPGGETLARLNGPLKWVKPITPTPDPAIEANGQVRPETLHYSSKSTARLYDFSVNLADLKPAHKFYLSSLVPLVRPSAGHYVVIHGMTSRTGTESHNLELSQKRMMAVRDYLKSIGVPSSHMMILFSGEGLAVGTTDEDPLDRAVVVTITDPPPPPPKPKPPPIPIDIPTFPVDPDAGRKFAMRLMNMWEAPKALVFAEFQIRGFERFPKTAYYVFHGVRISAKVGWASKIRLKGPWNEFLVSPHAAPTRAGAFGSLVAWRNISFGFCDSTISSTELAIGGMADIKSFDFGVRASVGGGGSFVIGGMGLQPPFEFLFPGPVGGP
jgi:outer membrane protein OmpA-like peptidoglycan-associated protein